MDKRVTPKLLHAGLENLTAPGSLRQHPFYPHTLSQVAARAMLVRTSRRPARALGATLANRRTKTGGFERR